MNFSRRGFLKAVGVGAGAVIGTRFGGLGLEGIAHAATPEPTSLVVIWLNGGIKDVKVVSASNPIFARASLRIVAEYKCQGQGREVTVTVPFSYRLE